MTRSLGTCYYPEHWPESQWAQDARAMADLGLRWVRIGEFAWSRLEPTPGTFDFTWLDRAIETLGNAGLQVVLGTPSAAPPRWMLARFPDMLAYDHEGRPRKFGSRRHYCFSHLGYRQAAAEMAARLAKRYAKNPHIGAWQVDNEYGCHDTTLSYSPAAQVGFRHWLRTRYGTNGGDITALNAAWGNVFWSMEYGDFEDIELPHLTVTQANPAHMLDFRLYTSDQVVAFNAAQVAAIRAHSRAPICHNYMGRITDFDHFKVGEDLDFASWDSYPLGFLEDRVGADAHHQRLYARQGDPDFQAFHHDLYRAVGRGRWWVMEQQPGPVNWAPYNPDPAPGMVRLWTWEAFAHGAEVVCYFRWRQAPMAQEQMHAGLLRPDSLPAPAYDEAAQVVAELKDLALTAQTAAQDNPPNTQAPVALVFDYKADAAWAIQPHGEGLSYFALIFETYVTLRRLGLSIDICPPTQQDFSGYKLILAPGMIEMPETLKKTLNQASTAGKSQVVIGPRSAARNAHLCIPLPLPPALPLARSQLDVRVARVESLRPDSPIAVQGGGNVRGYREVLEGNAPTVLSTVCGKGLAVREGNLTYLGAWLDYDGLRGLLTPLCHAQGLETMNLQGGMRVRDTGHERFWINYDTRAHVINGRTFAPVSVTRDDLCKTRKG